MKREIYVTDDGSHTMAIPDLHVTYHSTFGAIQESTHLFIEAGLLKVMAGNPIAEAGSLNYTTRLKDDSLGVLFLLLHSSQWDQDVAVHHLFTLHKVRAPISDAVLNRSFHLIYYDAFAPDIQPELWAADIYKKLHRSLYPGGVLVTYCCKGMVRKGLQEAGFLVEKLPGPRGKREILRAVKKE
jgi:hypothetical protein